MTYSNRTKHNRASLTVSASTLSAVLFASIAYRTPPVQPCKLLVLHTTSWVLYLLLHVAHPQHQFRHCQSCAPLARSALLAGSGGATRSSVGCTPIYSCIPPRATLRACSNRRRRPDAQDTALAFQRRWYVYASSLLICLHLVQRKMTDSLLPSECQSSGCDGMLEGPVKFSSNGARHVVPVLPQVPA